MKKYTQVEFDAVKPGIDGFRYFPRGDYSNIKDFGSWGEFARGCRFGADSVFGEYFRFGPGCQFVESIFGKRCYFDRNCNFYGQFYFGEESTFENGYHALSHECPYIAFDRGLSESYIVYFFLTTKGVIVRDGAFVGNEKEFSEMVNRKEDGWDKDSCIFLLEIAERKWQELKLHYGSEAGS